ncbi:MAG: DNA replication/repair protein RecF [Clostridia bacterium]|nr:DNA replication/repair protein RecF [Clostridia bacterium]
MYCKKIKLQDFRNIENEEIEFSDGINVIFGENAQGKTNILEGIYLFARGKSFRAFKDKELVKFDKSCAYAIMDFEKNGINNNGEMTLGVEIPKYQNKRFYRNKVKASKTSEIIGEFRAVLFCPSHLGIIKDSPSVRRRFLDVAISQLRPIYIKMMNQYNHVVENRNAILKMDPKERVGFIDMLDVYSQELAYLCADIAIMREEYIKKLDSWVKVFFEEMTKGKEKPKITYENNAEEKDFEKRELLKNKYFELLKNNLEREFKYGATLYGIHKDDLKIELNGKDARFYSSQGQQRSLALAMKMAEGEISREYSGEYPVFLFDDVLSELDDTRKQFILSSIEKRQVIITACDKSGFDKTKVANFIEIKNGQKIENCKDNIEENSQQSDYSEDIEKIEDIEDIEDIDNIGNIDDED